jgi:hypothetical protein
MVQKSDQQHAHMARDLSTLRDEVAALHQRRSELEAKLESKERDLDSEKVTRAQLQVSFAK